MSKKKKTKSKAKVSRVSSRKIAKPKKKQPSKDIVPIETDEKLAKRFEDFLSTERLVATENNVFNMEKPTTLTKAQLLLNLYLETDRQTELTLSMFERKDQIVRMVETITKLRRERNISLIILIVISVTLVLTRLILWL